MCCLRCLRDLEKWYWIEKIGKNGAKMGKNGQKWLSQNPQLYTTNIHLEVNLKHKSRKQTTCLHLQQPFGIISICKKWKKCSLRAFDPFLTMLSKAFHSRSQKSGFIGKGQISDCLK